MPVFPLAFPRFTQSYGNGLSLGFPGFPFDFDIMTYCFSGRSFY
jgi:hypothetical protein